MAPRYVALPSFFIVPTPWPVHVAIFPSLVIITPWPSPYCVPSGRTTVQYVPVSFTSVPSIDPFAWNEVSIFGPPPRFGSTRCEVVLPDVPPIFSPSINVLLLKFPFWNPLGFASGTIAKEISTVHEANLGGLGPQR